MSVPVSPSPQSGQWSTKKSNPVMPGWVVGLVAVSVGLGVLLYFLTRRPPVPLGRPLGVALLIDFSDSMPFTNGSRPDVDAEFDPAYLMPIEDFLAGSVGYDRRLTIIIIANSNSAKWTYTIPPKGDTMEDTQTARRVCRAAVPSFKAFLEQRLRGPVSSKTDIVEALERLSTDDPQRLWKVIVASDGLQAASRAAGTVNLEQTAVTSANVSELVRLAAPATDLPGLSSAAIEFVTPVRAVGDHRFRNTLQSTRLFWGAWMHAYAPTADLESFEVTPQPLSGLDEGGCE